MSNPSKRQILVVDDNPDVRGMFSMLLISAGYDVVVAEDGIAALAQLKKTLPDVVVSDLEMPRMSGFELLSVVRRRFPQVLTLAMSGAYPNGELPAGVIADAFCAKGRSPKNLLKVIEQLIDSVSDRRSTHQREIAPAWIPRNGNDSQGMPYVVLTCTECLRAFPMNVVEASTGAVLEIPCRFCPSTNKYIIQPSSHGVQGLYV
jgi:CheY-like chemotaxis protein